jgi:Ti-type conjugative transfer relaxase TraA
MAIYHFHTKNISRAQGRSAIGCAAYRAGERLHDERQDKTHDYTRKQDVLHTEILLPENAPAWMGDREKLWNHVESCEKRKDSRLARECEISLPRELTVEQNLALAKEFVQREFVDKGMVADMALHQDKNENGELQPHVHVMLTTREITPDGFGQKVTDWNRKELLLHWREQWADTANRHLALHGHDRQIDHRSFADQGINLEPQHKIGAVAAQEQMARLADHQRIARENGERIFKDPTIALNALTRQQSTFTHHCLARLINRHTVDAEQFERVYLQTKTSPELVTLGKDEKGRERLTTREMLSLEKNLVQQADTLNNRTHHGVSTANKETVLARYPTLSHEQKAAFEHLTSGGDLKNVVGYAGTGKSYMLGAAREAWEAQGYRVQGAALAGIAAENLTGSSGIVSRTIASRVAAWDRGEERLTSKDVLVIDEAGLIGSRQMARLIDEAQQSGAKIVLVGDPQQLQAIEAGAAFRALVERAGCVELIDIRRQHSAWQREATVELAQGNVENALRRYEKNNHIHNFDTREAAKQGVVEMWNDARLNEPDKTHIMLAYTRDDVKDMNEKARTLRQEQGELGKDHRIQTERGDRDFATGDRVYFLRNDRNMGVMNGTLGTITDISDNKQLRIQLDKDDRTPDKAARSISVDTSRYEHLDHGYAATYHKSQGATVDRSYVLASRYVDSHAAYVGFTRHRDSVDMCWSRDEFKNVDALAKSLARDSSKDMTVDYSYEFSKQRDIVHPSPADERMPSADRDAKHAEHEMPSPEKTQERHDATHEKDSPERADERHETLEKHDNKPEKERAHLSPTDDRESPRENDNAQPERPENERVPERHHTTREQDTPEHHIAHEKHETPPHEQALPDVIQSRLEKEINAFKEERGNIHEYAENRDERAHLTHEHTMPDNHRNDHELSREIPHELMQERGDHDAVLARLQQEINEFKHSPEKEADHPRSLSRDDDLETFRAQFEKQNPELAKAIEKDSGRAIDKQESHAHTRQKQYDREVER